MSKTVLLAASEFLPGPGGIGNHAYCLASGLHHAGYHVDVISILRDKNADTEFDRTLPFLVHRIHHGKPIRKVRLIIRKIKALPSTASNVVIASGLAMLVICGLYSRLRLRSNTTYVLVAHGVDINPTSFLYRCLVSMAIRGFHKVIAVSSYTAEKIRGVPKDNLVVINNGFDPEKFKHTDVIQPVLKKGNPSLITVGSVTYRKGQVNVINALPFLQQYFPDIHYHMIGFEHDKPKLLKRAHELGVLECITFHGPLSNSLLKAHLAVADIFVMLSNHDPSGDFEGFGIAVLEANYLGLPAIGSANSGLRDAIRSSYSGFLIKPDDAPGLKDAMLKILEHPTLYRVQAVEHASHFLWEKVIKQYIAVLK